MASLCFSGEKLERDELVGRQGDILKSINNNVDTFQVSALSVPLSEHFPICCLASCPICFPCVQTYLRYRVLNHIDPETEWQSYTCCQEYVPGVLCFQAGNCGERSCPRTCMCLEACLCPGFAMSASRMLMMEHYGLSPDPCDNRIMRFNNCTQTLSCVCRCISSVNPNLEHLSTCSAVLSFVADIVFVSMVGCMTAQVSHEIRHRELVRIITNFNYSQFDEHTAEREESLESFIHRT